MCKGISGIGDWFFLCLQYYFVFYRQYFVYINKHLKPPPWYKVNGIFDMKTISFEDLIKLGVKSVTVVMDGYQTKGIISHWEPFQRKRNVKFELKLYRGACYSLENESFVLGNQEEEIYSMDEEGNVFLYYPESIRES